MTAPIARAHVSDLERIADPWHPSNLVMPQYGQWYCEGCQRQRRMDGTPFRRNWKCAQCRRAGK